jgi:hypothetical protein
MYGLRSRHERALLLVTMLAAPSPALTDELRTHNGETLVGTVMEEHPTEIVFDSDTFGRIAVRRDFLFAVDDPSDYSSRAAVELSQKLGQAWSLSLRYDYTYDAVVGKDASEDQQRFALTIGLEF